MEKDVKQVISGAEALLEFLGPAGKPVAKELAKKRAEVCKHGWPGGSPCPLNQPAKDWVDRVSSGIAHATRSYFKVKDGLKLHVEGEEKLGICAACYCPLKLKVWMPIDYIAEHTTDEVMADFTLFCWIPSELQRP